MRAARAVPILTKLRIPERTIGQTHGGIKKDLEAITNSLKELKEDISNLRDTMNNKMQEHSDQMKELNNSLVDQKILSEKLLSSYKSLHKRVDYLFDVFKVDRNIFSNSFDHEDEEVNK